MDDPLLETKIFLLGLTNHGMVLTWDSPLRAGPCGPIWVKSTHVWYCLLLKDAWDLQVNWVLPWCWNTPLNRIYKETGWSDRIYRETAWSDRA